MLHLVRSPRPLILLAALAAPFAHADAPPDRIFRSGFTQALLIEGSAGYPGPLAHARVEAHFGDTVATATTAADGTYRVGLEIDEVDPAAIVEVFARGTGAQAQLVWASPLGPANRLLALAGDSHVVDFAKDPFVHLSPRSTVAAAAARAYNGWRPITDAATFWRAVRSRQMTTNNLVFALALVARGSLTLPEGADDTFAAVSTLASSQALYSAIWALGRSTHCQDTPDANYCVVMANLPLDARMFPPLAWIPGELYSSTYAFRTTMMDVIGFIPNGSGAKVLTGPPGNDQAVMATTTRLPGGGYELSPANGDIFYSVPSSEFVNGNLVPTRLETTKLYVRLTQGPGGQVEYAWSGDTHTVYPDNPEIPDEYWPYYEALMPMFSSNNALPAELLTGLPKLAGRRLVLPSPLPRSQDQGASPGQWLHGYDIHLFDTNTGSAQRFGQPFIFRITSPDSFIIDSNGNHGEFHFIAEEEPDVWRIRMHVTGDGYENVIDGVLIPADVTGGFTTESAVGTWRGSFWGDLYAGPYGDLDGNNSSLIMQATFQPDGSATRILYSEHDTGSWRMDSGSNAGRVLSDWVWPYDPPWLYERLGWELMHKRGDRHWVLENSQYVDDYVPVPPIVFVPTRRLIRYDRE